MGPAKDIHQAPTDGLKLYNRILGEDLVPVTAFKPPLDLAAVRSKAVVLLLLIRFDKSFIVCTS